MARVVCALLLCFFLVNARDLRADDVYLKDGRVLKGQVIEHGDKLEIKMMLGSITVSKGQVQRIVTRKTPEELFQAKYRQIDPHDPVALKKLAQWCRAQGICKYTELVSQAKIALLRRKTQQAGQDPDKLYQVVLWARRNHLPLKRQKDLLKRIIGLAPDHAAARLDLGQVRYQGRWLPLPEAKRLESRDFKARMRAQGLVFFRGEWMRPEEAQWIQEIATLRQQVNQLQTRCATKEEELKQAKQEIAQLQSNLLQLQDINHELQTTIATQRCQLERYARYQQALEAVDDRVRKLRHILAAPPGAYQCQIHQTVA